MENYLDLTPQQRTKPLLQIRLSNFLELSEEEFLQLIREVEGDDLFRRLFIPFKDFSLKVITRKKFPSTQIKPDFFELCDYLLESKSFPDVESILSHYPQAVKIAKKIGKENFKNYFLYNEFDLPLKELAKKCRLREEEILKVIEMVDKVFLTVKPHQSLLKTEGISYSRIASISEINENFFIEFLSLDLARGVYNIDYTKLKRLKERGIFSKEELKRIGFLTEKLTLINLRKSTLFKIVNFIVKKQKPFLETSQKEKLLPLTQKEAAKFLNISLSGVSRAIKYKTVEAPWGEEFPLRFFFPSLKTVRIFILKGLLEKEEFKTDREVSQSLKENYGIYLSRRTIAKYRKELKVSALSKNKNR
ncbi:MAG: hypothetical protein DRP80_04970 [Candidatus Omnitrophota bacterium]|nr:MAG: hypothetical protein DRP80_04970 [Candidatus Omnitrophota bacterium]